MGMIRWIRKNERKLMTFVVIFCMVAFVGGVGLTQFLSYLGTGGKHVVGTYFDNQKISNLDIHNAVNELEVLKLLMADRFLFFKPGPFGQPDINARLLAYLLFPDADLAAQLRAQLRQMVQQGQLSFTSDDIENFFDESHKPEIAWLLLNREAGKAGVVVSGETARETLRMIIPQLTQNQADAAQVVMAAVRQTNIPDQQIVLVFAKLLTVLNYADQVMDTEDVTGPQIRAAVARTSERIDAEFVKFPAEQFIEKTAAPEPNQPAAQFEKFKNHTPGRYSPDNPFGFGYKLPRRIQLEYFVLQNDDAAKIIDKPTPEEMESYYSKNISQFRSSVPVDPNKPDGAKNTVTQPYAVAADQIYSTLEQEKTDKLLQLIYKDARDLLEAEFEKFNIENASKEQIRQAAPDYPAVAAKIGEKHKIPVYTGKTGLLDARAFSFDACLGSLRLATSATKVPLAELLFAVDKTAEKSHRFLGATVPRLLENVGPLTGGFFSGSNNRYQRVMAVLRVIDVEEQQTPEDIDVSYGTEGLNFTDDQPGEYKFSIKEQVIRDLQTRQAFTAAHRRADELVGWVKDKNWESAVSRYNNAYCPAPAEPNSPESPLKLKIETLKDQGVASQLEIDNAFRIIDLNPASAGFIRQRLVTSILNRKLYEMLGENKAIGPVAAALPFEPAPAVYVVKSVKRKPPTTKDLLDNKAFAAYRLNIIDSVGLGLIHFNPKNIIRRTNFVLIKEATLPASRQEEMPPIGD